VGQAVRIVPLHVRTPARFVRPVRLLGVGMSEADRLVAEGALRFLRQMREQVDEAEFELVRRLRSAGATWAEIGALYGMTDRGARQRFNRLRAAR
jgi:hypothetical protein